MSTLFGFLSIVSFVLLVVGLIRPSWVKQKSRKNVSLIFAGAAIVFLIIGVSLSPNSPQTPATTIDNATSTASTSTPATAQSQAQNSQTDKIAAQKELDSLMALSKKSGLITTYEFSDSATVVYADSVWYTQSVQFKKDFLAKVGTLKKQITGYQHFEVRDAYSNEKVAEITSFGGSLEVYK